MQSIDPNEAREAEIARLGKSEIERVHVEKHLNEIIEGSAFKGSHRSGQFLRFIVEQAMAANFSSLKERTIGVELFGRNPSYDTGDDAIVRVTASDVRKRLLQHYGRYGSANSCRISLPIGSYLPLITFTRNPSEAQAEPLPTFSDADASNITDCPSNEIMPLDTVARPPTGQVETASQMQHHAPGRWRYIAFGAILALMLFGLYHLIWTSVLHHSAPLPVTLPWSAFQASPHALHLITSDPNIAELQGLTGIQISVSDYANHQYVPEPNSFAPEVLNLWRKVLQGSKCANVDASIAANFAELTSNFGKHIDISGARSIQLSDLRNDDDFILLGSPRSNPWASLFSDQLDFRLIYDKNAGGEFIQDLHPRGNETATYRPTGQGGATGQSFAIIAFVQNPDQSGQVLLISGANAEGTQAAGNFIRDKAKFSRALELCGISHSNPIAHFEMLLRLKMMAGTPNNTEEVACHILPSPANNR
jgi:hypothetical protein